MGSDFIAHLDKIQLLLFFSGYGFIFTLAAVLSDYIRGKLSFVNIQIFQFLPISYALAGFLYVGLELKTWYYGAYLNFAHFEFSYFNILGFFPLVFFVPIFRKKALLSLCHSLGIILFILQDLVWIFY